IYVDALAKEGAVLTALADEQAQVTVLKAVRAVVADYEAIVRRYPTSAYCDDALWRGGRLALDAFKRFGDTHDRDAGVRMLRTLASQYPISKFAKHARDIVGVAAPEA